MMRWLFLLFIPAAILAEHLHLGAVWIFVFAALAIFPLAGLMGEATEALAARAGSTVGGLLNATFGNAAELILAGMVLLAGKVEVVKASITGSILVNLLFALGIATLAGGLRYHEQRFNRESAGVLASLLTLTLIALTLPSLFDLAERSYYSSDPKLPDVRYSLAVAAVLILAYAANLWFSLVTHRDLIAGKGTEAGHAPHWSVPQSVALLLAATLGVAWMSELLAGNLEAATHHLGIREFFVGVILIPLVGNAAEYLAALRFAVRNKMDLAVQVAVGSSLQIALVVAPVLVFLSLLLGRPMDLVFQNPLELAALAATVLIANSVLRDGKSNWFEGVLLLAVYALLAFAFFFV